jgi:hypothetical protein
MGFESAKFLSALWPQKWWMTKRMSRVVLRGGTRKATLLLDEVERGT